MPGRLAHLGAMVAAIVLLVPLPASPAEASGFDLQAHRGGRGETSEESLRAFAKSLELGVSTLELDIVISKDGQPLVWHDPTIAAEKCVDTGPASPGDSQYPYVGKLVHELTLAQIHTLDCGRLLAEFPHAEVVRDNKIATLPEVFALADSYRAAVRYNIETKVEADKPGSSAEPQQFVDVILAAVRSAGKLAAVEMQSFDWRTLPMVHQAEPLIPLVALYNEETWVPDSPWLAGINAAAVSDPMIGALMVGANIVSPRYQLVTGRPYVDHAHALGLKVIPWTVNDPGAMREQIGFRVDGIITDYPSLLRGVLADLGMPLPTSYHRG
ncbi:putative glycerophosphoryl diester phosphodiesterase precursor [Mycobacterium montefiorense]|uniref:Glycerophosphoryl diester phosphodiesterase n=2 Tax=Mycobacterium montefiorense TaxID=154654 RepID=A0AA37UVZ2_9MYCO|nr:putative glycerophosphoryl diester phosphodiesterase precursor (GlpQ) [Mycobacterium montefiorense]GKU33125.1 putative glycerophosphoryl diester phosphodiesterase precursor [Mycobacterium montefiorense]GKU38405.1 putative glycerophosphoryl diester phosphodiesterase precursor [Mycobacterium montefiorense]GKU46829.1 putative glycerophosphoryl diester phosphodiesterase precursor [Mycobacterium montefiorense]GKU51399.1 putative glycerophosphoryl diester phosphodiesterase precursor [Mycobacterium